MAQDLGRKNRTVALACTGLVAGMIGLAYASVPLYQLFCQVTGFGGTTQRAERPADTVIDRPVTVRFDANIGPKLAWKFEPVQVKMTVKLGEQGLAFYRATNLTDKPLVGTATFNVTPPSAGAYFNKIECFCFTEQKLEPGASIDMPVAFFVDPEMAGDSDLARLKTITLSYTFFQVDAPKTAANDKPDTTGPETSRNAIPVN